MPGNLGQGVLIDNPGGVLEFAATNPLPSYASVSGAPCPTTPVGITITDPNGAHIGSGTSADCNGAFIDSGGAFGAVPQTFIPGSQVGGNVPVGDTINVYTDGTDQTLLYSETVTAANDPIVVPNSNSFNTGVFPFSGFGGLTGGTGIPIYLSYSPSGTGMTYFDT
jgi:hypothetical protein